MCPFCRRLGLRSWEDLKLGVEISRSTTEIVLDVVPQVADFGLLPDEGRKCRAPHRGNLLLYRRKC